MSRNERSKPLPVELEKQLQQIKDVRQRSDFRKQFKNDFAVVTWCEDFIKQATDPSFPYDKETQQEWLGEVPKRKQTLKEYKRRILRYKQNLEELIRNA